MFCNSSNGKCQSILVFAALALLIATASAEADWSTFDAPGATQTSARGIDGDNIVGYFCKDGSYHGFLYDGVTWTTIDAPGATRTLAYGIDGDNIVGWYDSIHIGCHGFVYAGAIWTTLESPVKGFIPYGIDGDNIVGWSGFCPPFLRQSFLYDGATWTTLDYPGASDTEAYAIDNGNIVGYYTDASQNTHGFLYDGVTWTTLDAPGALGTQAFGIDCDNIVGWCYDFSHIYSFVYQASGIGPAVLHDTTDLCVPQTNGEVYAVVQSGDYVYVAGDFTTIGGVARYHIAAFDAMTGRIDPYWAPDITGGGIYELAVAVGKVYVGGSFDAANGATRNCLAAFNEADGSTPAILDSAWNPDVRGTGRFVEVLAVSNGRVYAGGWFYTVNGDTTNRFCLAAFELADNSSSGSVDPWNPQVNSQVFALTVSDSKVYAGGDFTTVKGGTINRICLAAFELANGSDPGTVDPSWDPDINHWATALEVDDGKVYVGGLFTTVNGGITTRNRLAAFNEADGSTPAIVDPTWDPDLNDQVRDIRVCGGKVCLGGDFTTVNGGITTRNRLAAFNEANGISAATVDSWNPNANNKVRALAISGTGFFAGGDFTTIGGSINNYLAGFGSNVRCPGDFEPDGDIDFFDFAIFALAWLTEEGQAQYNPDCDISAPVDNSINMLDLSVFVENWLAGVE